MNRTVWGHGLAVALCVLCALTACSDDNEKTGAETPCPDGELITFDGEEYCILIEEGFLTGDCPPDFPVGQEVDGVIVCVEEGEELPEDIEEELDRRGFTSDGVNNEVNNDPNNGDLCEELDNDYAVLVANKACAQDSDCQILDGQCGVGIGGCYEIVNQSVQQGQLDALGADFEQNCVGPVCTCEAPPAAAACEAGICVAVEEPEPEVCPETSPLNNDNNSCRTPDLRCSYGEECCCGECFASLECFCTEDGTFACAATDACFIDSCEGRCDEDDPQVCGTDGVTYDNVCDSSDAGVEVASEGPCEDGDVCQSILDDYAALVTSNTACTQDSDCQLLNGQCGVGVGGCYEIVNQNVTQAQLNDLGRRYSEDDTCVGPVCDCPPAPEEIFCGQGGTCDAR